MVPGIPHMKKIRILNLARTEADSSKIRAALEKGFDIEWTRIAKESELRDRLSSGNWDLIICVCELDGRTRIDAHEILEESGSDIPFIIISREFDAETATEAVRLGVNDLLSMGDLPRLIPTVTRELLEAAGRSDKRAAEKALADGEDRMRLALRAAGIGAWEVDLSTYDAVWSPEASVILGVSVAGSKASVIRELVHQDDLDEIVPLTRSAIEKRRGFSYRIRLQSGSGFRWAAVAGKCEYDERGEPARIVGTIRDITKEKDAEDKLVEAEERYRIMAESASDGVVSIDETGTILFVNPAIEKMLGYASEEVLGKSAWELFSFEEGELQKARLQQYLLTGERSLDWNALDATARRKDGSELTVEISFGEYHKGDKHVFTGFVRDITEYKRQADALRRSEYNFRALVQATTEYVWQLDERANLTEFPHWWVELTGQGYEESLKYGWVNCVHPEDRERVQRCYIAALTTGSPVSLELRIRGKEGEYRHYSANGVPIRGENGHNRWICTLTEITVQREIEQRYKIVSSMAADYMFSARVCEGTKLKMDWVAGALEAITCRSEDYFNSGGTWRSIVHPDDHWLEDADEASVFEGKQVDSELRIVRPDGEVKWVRRLAHPVLDNERVIGVVGAVSDITERKFAELAVRERQEYLRTILNAEPQCVKIFAPAGEILDINPAGLAMIESDTLEELLGRQPFHIIDKEDVEPFKSALARAFSGETVTVTYRITGFKGTPRRMEMTAAPIRDAESRISTVLGVSRDITEQHRMEAELVRSQKQHAELINTVEGIVWELEIADMRFTFVSEQAESILGYPVKEWFEKDFWTDHIYPEDREFAVNYCAAETEKGEGHTFEYRMIASDGRVVWLRDIVSVVTEDGKPVKLRGLMVDVTEQRRMDAAVKQQALLIEQSNEAIFVWDVEQGVIEWNLGCEKLYGYSRDEVLGRFPQEFLRTQLPTPIEQARKELFDAGVWKGEVTHTTKAGAQVLVDASGQVIELGGRKVVMQTSRDITEMRRAEDALRRSEIRYRHLFENNPYPMWVYDSDTLRFLAVNDSAVQHYGYTVDEFRSMKITDIRPQEDVAQLIERAGVNARYMDSSGRWRHLKKDGTVINVQITSHALQFEGRPARLVLANDVTDQLRAEEALRESEAKYRELVANANDIIYTHDLEGRFTSLNHAGERVTGYTEEEAKLLYLGDAVAPEFMQQARAMIETKLATGSATIYETELIAKDGRRIPIEVNSRLIYENGKPVAVQGIARDFTERRKAEEELRQQRERLDKTAEAAPVMICSLKVRADGTRIFPFASRVSMDVFGFTPEELRGSAKPVFDRIDPDYLPNIENTIRDGVTSGSTAHVVFEYDHPERGRIWIEIYGAPTAESDGGVVWHGIATDITEQKHAEKALLASEEQLRQVQKLESIGILAGGLAHDFNNMLTAINGYSDLILRRVSVDDPLRKNVEEIRKAGERSAELTRQLLAFSRRQILQPTMIDLNTVISDTASMMKRLIGEDIVVTTKLASNLAKIKADQGQLTQVLMNLLINARDAMPKGGSVVVETANVEFDREYASRHLSVAPGRYVMLAISDTGIGMDAQTRSRVFEPFFTTKPVGRGTGLGLSTVYGIVKQSGGNVWVYSEPGKGTTFKIYLPEASGFVDTAQNEKQTRPSHVGSEKVLLVEDEDSVRGLARQILESCGYEVFEATNGAEAITKFESEFAEIDLLITDIVMPEMGGRELSEKVTTRCPHIKVLFTSGYTDDGIIRHGIIDQGKNFLQKPFTFDGLARKVRSVLDQEGNLPRDWNKPITSNN